MVFMCRFSISRSMKMKAENSFNDEDSNFIVLGSSTNLFLTCFDPGRNVWRHPQEHL